MSLKKIKDIDIEDIIEFRDFGKMKNVPEEIVFYLQEMDKVRGMYLRFDKFSGRDAIINHLIKFDNYSHYLAAKLYDDTIEYFYLDRKISKEAHRNRLAEKMEKGIDLAFALARDANEVLKAVDGLKKVAEVLGLDKTDKPIFPEELLQKPIKLYTTSAEDLGMPSIDRYELGRIIDQLPDITEGQKQKAKRDAMLLPVKIFEE